MFVIYLIFTAAFGLIAWRDLHLALLLLIALLPSYLLRTEILGLPTTLLEMLLVAFVTIWCIRRRPRIASLFALPRSVALPISLLFLASLFSLFIAPDLTAALGVWKAYYLEPMLLFFIVRTEIGGSPCSRDPHGESSGSRLLPEKIIQSLGVCTLFLSVIAITQWLTGQGIPIPWDIERRVTSVFDYPNALGLFLGPIVVIGLLSVAPGFSLGALLKPRLKPGATKYFWLLVITLSSLAIVLAQSEAAIVAVIATLMITGLLNKKTRIKTCLVIFVSIATIWISPWRGFVIEKLTLQDFSGQVRLTQWSETIDMLQDHWLLGTGLSGYPTVFEPYHKATHIEIFQYPHNIILNIWVELGLLGLIAFVLLAFQVLHPFLHTKAGAVAPAYEYIASLALLQISIHGLVDVPYFKNDLAILTWILLAILFSYAPHATPTQEKN